MLNNRTLAPNREEILLSKDIPITEKNSNHHWVVDAENITKIYQMGAVDVHALRGVTVKIASEEMISIIGPSGSGKSTLMNILGCLDRPTSGLYRLNGEDTEKMTDDQLAGVRNRGVGFVFQTFNLLPRVSALENVELPLRYSSTNNHNHREKAEQALEAVGLGNRLHHHPNELSGGQQQRVAIARALVNDPAIVLADEPTGSVDSRTGAEIMDLLVKLNQERGTTILIVTHDPEIIPVTERVISIRDGKIEE